MGKHVGDNTNMGISLEWKTDNVNLTNDRQVWGKEKFAIGGHKIQTKRVLIYLAAIKK